MSELLFFIIGLVIGGLATTTLLCCLQINRTNEMERQIIMSKIEMDEEEY